MISRIKLMMFCTILMVASYGGWRIYGYFFDKMDPIITIDGLKNDDWCGGKMTWAIQAEDTYRLGEISVFIDKEPLLNHQKVGASSFIQNFEIDSKEMSNGIHALKIHLTKGNYYQNRVTKEISFMVDNDPLIASFVNAQENDFKVPQGKTLHMQFQSNKKLKTAYVEAFSERYDFFPESKNSLKYECFIPVVCEQQPNAYLFAINMEDNVGNTYKMTKNIQVISYPFKKQSLRVNSDKVAHEKEIGKPNDELERRLEELVHNSPKEKLWKGSFYAPTEVQSISTEFGTIRTTQEKGKYLHKGVDILNAPKSAVWAPQNGIVVIKERYAMSGNTIAIDHGCGIFSLYFHLDSFANIQEGQEIKQGNPIGTLGGTGYTTGPHLHMEKRIKNIHVDPLQWMDPNF